MEDKSLIYKETLDDKIGGVLKYEKRFGKLSKKEAVKKIPLALIVSLLLEITVFQLDGSIWFYIVFFVLTAAVGSLLIIFLGGKAVEREIVSTYSTVYRYRTDESGNKKITLKNDGIELMSPYSKAYLPYEDIEAVTSDRLNFVIKIKGDDRISVVPKSGQNPQILFDFDNIFKEKLADRFIYEM